MKKTLCWAKLFSDWNICLEKLMNVDKWCLVKCYLPKREREVFPIKKMLCNLSFFSSFVSCDLELNNIIEFKCVSDVLTDPEVLCGGRRLGWKKLGCAFYIYGDLNVELVSSLSHGHSEWILMVFQMVGWDKRVIRNWNSVFFFGISYVNHLYLHLHLSHDFLPSPSLIIWFILLINTFSNHDWCK